LVGHVARRVSGAAVAQQFHPLEFFVAPAARGAADAGI